MYDSKQVYYKNILRDKSNILVILVYDNKYLYLLYKFS